VLAPLAAIEESTRELAAWEFVAELEAAELDATDLEASDLGAVVELEAAVLNGSHADNAH
jgi:DNA recombination protein RmuC